MRLSVFGLGQVGQVLCACFAEQGHSVAGVDVDSAKATDFSRGMTQLQEPKLAEMLARHAASGMIAATTNAAAAVQATAKEAVACDKADGFAEVRRSVPLQPSLKQKRGANRKGEIHG